MLDDVTAGGRSVRSTWTDSRTLLTVNIVFGRYLGQTKTKFMDIADDQERNFNYVLSCGYSSPAPGHSSGYSSPAPGDSSGVSSNLHKTYVYAYFSRELPTVQFKCDIIKEKWKYHGILRVRIKTACCMYCQIMATHASTN